MLTRREYLLKRPWQERRYIYHREKVLTALPAIDNSTPPHRPHVSCKLKKLQKEAERCSQIVNDNFTLLQHLSNIVRTTRVDHFWEETPPKFLQRVGIYKLKKRVGKEIKTDISDDERPKTRKERCYGCSPERFQRLNLIPEERVPFPLPKRRTTRRPETPPDWEKQYQFRCSEDRPEFRGKIWKKSERESIICQIRDGKHQRSIRRRRDLREESQKIFLSKGGLTLAVKFPSRTEVLMSNQRGTRVIQKELCECKSFPKRLANFKKSLKDTVTLHCSEKLIMSEEFEKKIENDTLIGVMNDIDNLKLVNEEIKNSNENSFEMLDLDETLQEQVDNHEKMHMFENEEPKTSYDNGSNTDNTDHEQDNTVRYVETSEEDTANSLENPKESEWETEVKDTKMEEENESDQEDSGTDEPLADEASNPNIGGADEEIGLDSEEENFFSIDGKEDSED